MRARRYRDTITVDVDIDIIEVLSEVSDEQLLEECKDRDLISKIERKELGSAAIELRERWIELSDDMRAVMATGDRLHMEVLLLRMAQIANVPRLQINGAKKELHS